MKGWKMHKETPVDSFPLEEENDLKWVVSFPVYLITFNSTEELVK